MVAYFELGRQEASIGKSLASLHIDVIHFFKRRHVLYERLSVWRQERSQCFVRVVFGLTKWIVAHL